MALGDPCRVLLVDDDRSFLEVIDTRLGQLRSEFEVVSETSPASALDQLESAGTFDCIVSDYRMPEMTGIEFLHAVRDRGLDTPFIVLTGEGDEAVASEAIDAGATNYMQKGATREDVEALATAIEDAVSTHRERRLLREEFQFLDRVLGTLDDIVYVTNTTGQPLYWNQAATAVTGYDSTEVRSLDVLDLFPPSEHERVRTAIETTLESGSATFEGELLTKDGERIPYEFSETALRDNDGNVIGICGVGRDVTQRVHYERTLRSLHETTRTLLGTTSPERVASIVASATERIVDNPLSTVFLREGDDLVSAAATDELGELVGSVPEYEIDEDVPPSRVFRSGDPELIEDLSGIDDDRERMVGSALFLPLGEYGVLALAHRGTQVLDETNRQLAEILAANAGVALQWLDRELALERRDWMLQTLHGTTRELMRTNDPQEIGQIIIDDASDILDFSESAVFLWNDQTGVLELAEKTDGFANADPNCSTISDPDHPVWEAFVTEDSRVVSGGAVDREADKSVVEGAMAASETAQSQLLVPIAGHGVLVATSPEADAFDDSNVEFAELLAANASTALGRAERERSLQDKDRRLQERNEQLRRVNRLNAIIRDINEALVQSTSRADIQQVVCETLLDVDYYTFTWIGSEETANGLVVHASAGDGRSFLDTVLARNERSVPERVLDGGEPIVIDDIHRDETFETWREPALNSGFQSLACFPLTHGDREYGVLEIYADRPGVFSDDEIEVLSELATQIANAIDAIEHKEALLTGRAIELELELRNVDDPLFRIARRAETTIDVDGIAPHGTDAWNVYATIDTSDPTSFVETARASTVVSDVDVLQTREETTLVRLTVHEFTVADVLAEEDATIRTFRVGPDSGRVTVTIPTSANVRSFLDQCREQFTTVNLVRRQSVTDSPMSDGLRYDIDRLLTDKQLEALQTAYFRGYFEWPRKASSEDIADTLDVSRPTFQQHLRKALARIFDNTFRTE